MSEAKPELFEMAPDRWLAEIIGRPAYTLRSTASEGVEPSQALARLRKEGGFATAKIPASDVSAANRLVDAGFRVVDTALSFARTADAAPMNASVREAMPHDSDRVRAIAARAFSYSRFHLDPRFPNELANRIKKEWAGNFFGGQRGDAMLIAQIDGVPAGFCQLLLRGADAIIDLIAVDPGHVRGGLARKMVESVPACAAKRGLRTTRIVVGTQAANTPSVNLYESCGFRLSAATLVLHATA